MELTRIEKLNLTYEMTHSLAEWEKSSRNPIFGSIAARVVTPIASIFTGIIDTIAHLIIGILKIVSGVVVSPYNFVARCFDEKYAAPADLELSSACLHLFLAFKSLVFIPVVAVTATFSPELASLNADSRIIFRSRPAPFTVNFDFS